MKEKALKLLGLMRRANAIQPGEDRAGDTVQAGRAKLLLLASDAADNARRKAEKIAYSEPLETHRLLECVGNPEICPVRDTAGSDGARRDPGASSGPARRP